ncbi:hypothetical protein FOE74_13120 [Rufibacter glacialis]|uniref:STAS/SEC14 domain-containing protein n=1 Tax=Rufibacter glacialis TaxID=1259555 RepID=A0A5M8QEQ9_9BACT|nr:hypothetical protein FOE74_13120 [Rufibacter glacialis]
MDILFLRWLLCPDSAQLRDGYRQSLELAKEVQSAYWMFDLRSRGIISPEDEAWMLEQFFPQVEEEISGQSFFANLVTPTHYTHIREGIGLEYLENFGTSAKLGVFLSEQEAIAWLLKSRADR